MPSDRRRVALVLLAGACSPDIQDDLVFDPSTTSTTDPLPDPTSSTGPVDPTTSTGEVADTSSSSSTTEPAESSSSEGPAPESSSTTEPTPSVCGNGVLEEGEACDDMNDNNIDGCSNDCAGPGEAIWNAYYAGLMGLDDTAQGVAVDGEGNVVLVGTTGLDVRIAKYDPSGVQTWQVIYDAGLFLADYAYDVAIDSNDDIVVAGSIYVENYDLWLAKYSDDGVLQWSEWHTGPVSIDRGFAVRIDDADDIYVGGFEFVSQQGRNAWLGKYTPGGNYIWGASFNGPASNGDELASIDFDTDGNIVAAGTTDVDGEDNNILVGKWDPEGNEIWVVDHNGPQGTNDIGLGIGATPDGGMIVVGATQVLVDIQGGIVWDMWMGKFDTDGVLEWEETYDGPLMGEDIAEEVEVDSQGNFIVVGTLAVDEDVPGSVYNGQQPQRRGWIRKYDPDAQEIWTYDYGPQNRWTWAFDVSLAANDDIFVAGQNTQMDAQADPDMFLLKLSP